MVVVTVVPFPASNRRKVSVWIIAAAASCSLDSGVQVAERWKSKSETMLAKSVYGNSSYEDKWEKDEVTAAMKREIHSLL